MADEKLSAVADPELRAALLYARGRDGSFTADDAAAALDVHRNVARSRLDRLVEAGLLLVTRARRSGRSGPGAGRPAKVYAVAPETESISFPARRYETLLGLMLDRVPAESLRPIGEQFGRELAEAAHVEPAADVAEGLERACAAVRSLGYQVSVAEVEGDRAALATPTCPLRPLVQERPEAVEVDRGMWAGLVESCVRGARAEQIDCETADCLDHGASCRVLLRLRLQSGSSSQAASASGETESSR